MTIGEAVKMVMQLADEERYGEALQIMQQMHRAKPTDPILIHELGILNERLGNVHLAIAYFERAIAIKPSDPFLHWPLALASLLIGDFDRGWREFEWRLKVPGWLLFRGFSAPQWTGQQNILGKTILLHAEGGHGDAIQFGRYISLVHQRGATILVECQPALVPLLSRLPALTKTIARGEPLPPFDYQCPLQSLPLAFGTRVETIPPIVPDLIPDPAQIQHWQRKLGPRTAFRVGLAWCGSDTPPHRRSRTLSTFAPLGAISGVEFHSLQTGPAAAEPSPPGLEVINHSKDLTDFSEIAALVSQVDLVISVDTSIAHLAGALGKEVWVLIPKLPDFRWLLNRTDSPWYPTMRLFRQSRQTRHWDIVAMEIATALRRRLGK